MLILFAALRYLRWRRRLVQGLRLCFRPHHRGVPRPAQGLQAQLRPGRQQDQRKHRIQGPSSFHQV